MKKIISLTSRIDWKRKLNDERVIMVKYTKELLEKAARESESIAGVLRSVGIKYISGGIHAHISRRLKKFGIDTSHFTGQGHYKGKSTPNKLHAEDVFVLRETGGRQKRHILWRCLLEVGRGGVCEECGQGPLWEGKDLVLQIDHINGDFLDDREDNLRILCPNCHTQTPTFGRGGSNAGMSELVDERRLERRALGRAGSSPVPRTSIQYELFEAEDL